MFFKKILCLFIMSILVATFDQKIDAAPRPSKIINCTGILAILGGATIWAIEKVIFKEHSMSNAIPLLFFAGLGVYMLVKFRGNPQPVPASVLLPLRIVAPRYSLRNIFSLSNVLALGTGGFLLYQGTRVHSLTMIVLSSVFLGWKVINILRSSRFRVPVNPIFTQLPTVTFSPSLPVPSPAPSVLVVEPTVPVSTIAKSEPQNAAPKQELPPIISSETMRQIYSPRTLPKESQSSGNQQ